MLRDPASHSPTVLQIAVTFQAEVDSLSFCQDPSDAAGCYKFKAGVARPGSAPFKAFLYTAS